MINSIISAISNKDNANILIITHTTPDGDAVGSSLALKYALELKYPDKNIAVLCDEKPKERIARIYTEFTEINTGANGETIYTDCPPFDPDLIITVDTSVPALMGRHRHYADDGLVNIKIDHHPPESDYAADINYTDTKAAAAGEIIYDICTSLGVMDKRIGDALFAALAYDTGVFKFSNVTSKTHRIAAALIDAGTEPHLLIERMFGQKTKNEITALKAVYNNIRYHTINGINTALIIMTNTEKRLLGISDDDIGDIHSIARDIEGVDLGITLRQKDTDVGRYRLSMRSGQRVDASAICKMLGGGGHVRASGAIIDADDLETAEEIVFNAVRQYAEFLQRTESLRRI
jgi:phosphoesterase RecJ-like protein